MIVYGITIVSSMAPPPPPVNATLPWPAFGHDVEHSSSSNSTGPAVEPSTAWLNGGSHGSVSVGGNDAVFSSLRATAGTVVAYSSSGDPLWLAATGIKIMTSPLLGEAGAVYIAEKWSGSIPKNPVGAFVGAFSPSGAPLWNSTVGYGTQELAKFGNVLIVATQMYDMSTGVVHGVSTSEGVMQWTTTRQLQTVWTSGPAINIDTRAFYIGSQSGYLWAFSVHDGTTIFSVSADDAVNTPIVSLDRMHVHFVTDSGTVFSALATTGVHQWRTPLCAQPCPPTASRGLMARSSDGTLLFVGVDYNGVSPTLYALAEKTGEQKWFFSTDTSVTAVITGASDMVFAGDIEGNLFALVGTTGKLAWKMALGGRVNSLVMDGTGRLIVATNTSLMALV